MQKRTNSNTEGRSSKHRKRTSNSSIYILKTSKDLSTEQIEVRRWQKRAAARAEVGEKRSCHGVCRCWARRGHWNSALGRTGSHNRKQHVVEFPHTGHLALPQRQLMKKIKKEIVHLTGDNNDAASDVDDLDSSFIPAPLPILRFDFSANVAHLKVIDYAANLIWMEQSNPEADTCHLAHKNVKFTRADLTEFAKGNFRSLKKKSKIDGDPERARNQARTEPRGRQEMRRKEASGTKSFERCRIIDFSKTESKPYQLTRKKYQRDPGFILESDWMSDELSCPDIDDEDQKAAHRRRLVQVAHFTRDQKDDAVWELVRPGFQSNEVHLPFYW
ncbi:hypothetical protein DFH09DRAFT_1091379 [Mycena vulgaris]|nr:hypothetical protein DFH09DRAFT_1091379 [Mycena vulgaris]